MSGKKDKTIQYRRKLAALMQERNKLQIFFQGFWVQHLGLVEELDVILREEPIVDIGKALLKLNELRNIVTPPKVEGTP